MSDNIIYGLKIHISDNLSFFYHFFLNIACDIKIKSYICIVSDINNN